MSQDSTEGIPKHLPAEVRQTLRSYLEEVTKLFGQALEAIILYGSAAGGEFLPDRSNLNVLIILAKQDTALLEQYAKIHKRWGKERIVVPLFLTQQELQASAALFPLEYLEMKERHVLLVGRDPFPSLHVDQRNLGLQCKQEIRGNLLRLRQRFVEGGGKQEAILILLPLSLTSLLPCLRGLLRIKGLSVPAQSEGFFDQLQAQLGIDPAGFQEVLSLKRGQSTPGPLEVPRLFDRYVASLEGVIQRVEQLKAEGKW
ncbi:MAG: nucleotidyltransferase domain-containing protein [Nitrospirae bacterium]|nr:MAG: nucleotidyltransferase domain-containing protein [Nitrospirota bacterium]